MKGLTLLGTLLFLQRTGPLPHHNRCALVGFNMQHHHHLRQLKWGSSEDMENVSPDGSMGSCLPTCTSRLRCWPSSRFKKPHKG